MKEHGVEEIHTADTDFHQFRQFRFLGVLDPWSARGKRAEGRPRPTPALD